MANLRAPRSFAKRLKKYAGPVYRLLPPSFKAPLRRIYQSHISGPAAPAKTVVFNQTPAKPPAPKTRSSVDHQKIDTFLATSHRLRTNLDEREWLRVGADPLVIDCAVAASTEIHLAFRTRVVSDHVGTMKLNVSCGFSSCSQKLLSERQSCELVIPHSEQLNAVRITVPKGASRAALEFKCSSAHEVEVLNDAQISTVDRGISMIVGVHKEEKLIGNLLRSISAQTASKEAYEVIFIVNGERDNSDHIITEWMKQAPDIQATLLYETMPSLSNARNAGIAKAAYSHLTFVDADDTISEEFLSSMLSRLEPDQISCSNIVNIDENGNADVENVTNAQLVAARSNAPNFSPQSAVAMSTMSACKAIPTYLVRCVPFIVHLKNGEDTPFYCEIYARFPHLQLNADADQKRCVYFRLMRQGSLSRTELNFDFNIVQRLDVVKALERVLELTMDESLLTFIANKRNAQVDFSARYLQVHPSQYRRTIAEVEKREFRDFPWDRLKNNSTNELVISYCFPPFQDASAIVMAKRIFTKGELCDVISNKMTGSREVDPRLLEGIEPFITRHTTLATSVSFAGWKGISAFAEKARDRAIQIQDSRKRSYIRLYSRAQWCASHFGALLVKIAQPEITWTAEFSDPLLFDAEGNRRDSPIEIGWLRKHGVLAALDKVGASYDIAEKSLFYWCEVCAIYLADELIFTNDNQLKYMCSYLDNKETVREATSKARVSPHPVAKGWLESSHIGDPNPRNLNLAYFGSFYPNRGTASIFEAISHLPKKQRSKIRFFIYSRQFQQAERLAERLGLGDLVICRPEIMYVDMMREMKKFDVLVVNDAVVPGGQINPFLPSKLSDYLLSGVPILALYQLGSALSKRPEPQYRARIYKSKKRQSDAILELFKQAMYDKKTSFFAPDLSEEEKNAEDTIYEPAR